MPTYMCRSCRLSLLRAALLLLMDRILSLWLRGVVVCRVWLRTEHLKWEPFPLPVMGLSKVTVKSIAAGAFHSGELTEGGREGGRDQLL